MSPHDYTVTYRAFGLSRSTKEWADDLRWMTGRLPERPDVIRSGVPQLIELLPEEFRDIPITFKPTLRTECWFGYRD